jgi:hypothetical protein
MYADDIFALLWGVADFIQSISMDRAEPAGGFLPISRTQNHVFFKCAFL